MKIKHDSQGPRTVHECDDCKPQRTPTQAVCIETDKSLEYVRRAVNAHEDMLNELKNALYYLTQNKKCRVGSDQWMIEQNIRKAIVKAEAR